MDAKLLAIPLIVSMVAGVSTDRVRSTDTALVGFGTRNDFSETSSTATTGIFGARDWIVKQFDAIAATSGGRMTVRTDDYLQPKTARTPRDVTESSVVATLAGDEPGRTYIMSSHYDDCHGDCTDGTGVAPGADDNASGVAAVLEAARVMAPHHFKGTILFVCFDGEELGLWGSAHLADELKAKGEPVLAMLNNDVIGNSAGGSGVHVFLVLWKAASAVQAYAEKSISALEMCGSDFAVLEALLHKGALPVNEIGRKVLLTSGSITWQLTAWRARAWSSGALTRLTGGPE